MSSEDRSGQTVNGALCTYANMDNYTQGCFPGVNGQMSASCKKAMPTNTRGVQVVPCWPQLAGHYDALTKGSSCSGYPSIVSAYNSYGYTAENCSVNYKQRQCNDPTPVCTGRGGRGRK